MILLVTAALVVLVPWDRLPAWCDVTVPLLYTASVLPLAQAAGGTYSGILIILLSPIIWTVLFGRPWESAVVSAAALAVVLAVSLMPDMASPAVLIRRMIAWAALAAMIAVAGHGLRARIRRSRQQTALMQERLREMSILADRDRIAASLHDTVVQRLFASGLSLQSTAGLLGGRPEVAGRIDQVVRDLDESITLLRQSIFDPAHGAPARGLRRSILDVSRELTPWLGVVPEVTLEGPLDTAVPSPAARQLLGVLREGLAHSGAYAHATQVAVAVAADQERVTLTITDDGTRWAARSAGNGSTLPALRARARPGRRDGGDRIRGDRRDPADLAGAAQGASQRRPIQIARIQNPAKMTPSTYMTGTMTPAAITRSWSTLPATRATRHARPADHARQQHRGHRQRAARLPGGVARRARW